MEVLKALFEQYTGEKPIKIKELPRSGSNRLYYRLWGENSSIIGTKGTCKEENMAFWEIAKHFHNQGLPVPKVYCRSDDFIYYLQEDLGDDTLFQALEVGRLSGLYSSAERALLRKTIAALPKLQFKGAEDLDFSVCYPQPAFDQMMISFDLNYFKYCFLKATGLSFNELNLEMDFRALSEFLLGEKSNTFLYRDFQSRNVMLKDGEPYFIDFQGGRKGPVYYDVASFLWQARANYSPDLREELLQTYLDSIREFTKIDPGVFKEHLRHFVLFRTLQVLGAYGFRGYFEKKPHFLQSVPYAMDNLRYLLQEPFTEYPYLNALLNDLIGMKQFNEMGGVKKLEVRIYSFAYKKGIPNDSSGNGGGYVFDCRAINNPGKYDRFHSFTGMDPETIKFLEEDGEIIPFMEHIYVLAETHVKRYIDRKFTNLMFAFGCTGGQHRSVYCAEHLAVHLAARYDIRIKVYHRELNIEKTL